MWLAFRTPSIQTMFPIVGWTMDRFGRKYVGVPALLIMGFGAFSATVRLTGMTMFDGGSGTGRFGQRTQ